jgi:hypothetical protein
VHEKTLGGSTAIAQARPTIAPIHHEGQRGVRVSRFVSNVPSPPYYQRFRSFSGPIDRWFVYDFLLPGTLLMKSGGRPAGSTDEDMSNAVQLHSCQTLTPETETSTHYFFQQSHPGGPGTEEVTDKIFATLVEAFNEDRDMISAQYENLKRAPERPMRPLYMDAALTQFRKLLSDEHAAEQACASPSLEARAGFQIPVPT